LANNKYVQLYYSHLAATIQGPGFLVMALGRFGRGYLHEWHDMMAAVSVIGFVAPALDPYNAGANAVGGEGNNVNVVAVVEIHVARAAENKGEGVGGAPLLEPRVTDAVEGERGVEGNGAPQKHVRSDVF
jgi:hypothetical protein